MSSKPLWVTDIENLARGLPVVLIEGQQDRLILTHFLDQQSPDWKQRFYLAIAGSKSHVITGVAEHHPDWVGIVDRDEWSESDVEAGLARSPHLKALSRFCAESYFCHPEELWPALPEQQRAKAGDHPASLAGPIYGALPDWVAHGAMWRVLRELYKLARLPAELESKPVTDEAEIRRILETWHRQLAPELVLEKYHQELQTAQGLSRDAQLTTYIHGKKFYLQVVVQALDHLFGGKGADDWLQKFRDAPLRPPADMRDLLEWLLASIG